MPPGPRGSGPRARRRPAPRPPAARRPRRAAPNAADAARGAAGCRSGKDGTGTRAGRGGFGPGGARIIMLYHNNQCGAPWRGRLRGTPLADF
ncbi:hypothetical protein L550_0310 [Bordetella pertussis H973]|uniref:Uncharacterized protein n=1 Tax=Bordetella pertussis CHLA-26 TaxID=1331284 RepID=A0AAI9NG12_BORPT|nr:hypothetical protein V483_0168 [Bordetella pertussis CHLA-11]ETG99380.1 hypothetical protein L569_0168 [Bordetella pertussis 2250905]ETH05933.1 hypothetical protein L570_0181 [Bordetella pertussis 2356847]ETH09868.1 hypothetical protein L571_0189 [Bordetella pertussis 2371640]ETH13547.1 hypothetical protein L574_0387 [Bordetella pertussis STO1-SEAT-0006]ETH13976.1 hypothetical protein L575_0935 [Bordetella pertussis STO1-SEAT-0007]ETH21519.1 hypothetical protein L563_0162 [Bordetella pertu